MKMDSSNYASGLLANLVLDDILISPDTPITDVVRFRNRHRDEIARFRNEINKLANEGDNQDNLPPDALLQKIQALYDDGIKPAVNDLKSSLRAQRISGAQGGLSAILFCSPVFSAMQSPQLDLGLAISLGIGATLVTNVISYRLNRKEALRQNPYSYLVKVAQRFSSDS